jgi:hypothetical protein
VSMAVHAWTIPELTASGGADGGIAAAPSAALLGSVLLPVPYQSGRYQRNMSENMTKNP